jgi:hypothetical protein
LWACFDGRGGRRQPVVSKHPLCCATS